MRKMYVLIGSIALGVGLVIGVVGYALATTPADGNPRLAFWENKDSVPTSGVDSNFDQSNSLTNPSELGIYPVDPNDSATTGGMLSVNPEQENLDSAEGIDPHDPNILNTPDTSGTSKNIPTELTELIISDYKLNLGSLFDAWKSTDMVSFRAQLSEAYTGELFEKHARQAERFIAQGVGIEVSDIRFDSVTVEAATATSATLTAYYHYIAKDYDIANEIAMGGNTEHQVKVRVNMVKDNGRWLTAGETLLP
ncbi:MAG: hypothetical protein ACRKFN_06040 [Desulfitobacterium sp.]